MVKLIVNQVSVQWRGERAVVSFHVELRESCYSFDFIYDGDGHHCRPTDEFPEVIQRSMFPKHLAALGHSAVKGERLVLPMTISTDW